MANLSHKTRPAFVPPASGIVTPLGPGLCAVETAAAPDDARALVAATSPVLGAPPDEATTICVRTDAGELLATVSVGDAVHGPLAAERPPDVLRRTAWLGGLAASDRELVPHALYLAVRRARIRGAAVVALHADDAGPALPLDLVALDGPAVGRLRPRAQRVDLAAHAAHRAAVLARGSFHPRVFGDEVRETFHAWLRDLYSRGFFRAITDRTLGREQYVHTVGNMHQFVRWTTRLLGRAVATAHDRSLRDHFLQHLQGEINHEVILERDLAHLGEDVTFVVERMEASPGTRHFMAVQESLVGFHHDPVHFLASPLAAEGVASHLTPGFLVALEENIRSWGVSEPRKAMTFFTSHVGTDGGDDGHWEQVLHVVRERLRSEDDARRFLGVLRASTTALTRAYDEFVDDLAVFARRP